MPPIFEWFLFQTDKKIYFDYDDAIYHNYDLSDNLIARLFLSSKIRYLMRKADGVIVGNNYIEKYAKHSGATNILKLPTVVDIDTYTNSPVPYTPKKNFTVGWIGSPSTSKYLKVIEESLIKLGKLTPVTLYLVGASNKLNLSIDNVEIVSVEWSEKNEQKALREFDVGIMPLFDEQWEKGKCAFKLIQYMAAFLPVVSSNVGMNAEIINNRKNQNGHEVDTRLSKYEVYDNLMPSRQDGVNAFVSISRGCDKFCTFCIVPFTRGRERSRSNESIIREVQDAVKNGFAEITLL